MAYAGTLTYKTELDTSGVQKAGSTVKSIIAGLGITKLISTAMSQISNSIDGAISRIDTFDQYPKVLQNFGVSAEEASESIKRIDKTVRGLPTPLDQAVAGVQDIFMVTKDLSKAENIFKAINDSAMIFAKGSTESVDRFAYAYKQALASGKVYAQDFNQMNQAIPGIMDKVAESMGVNFAELKDGLSEGNITMEQFNEALLKLDTEGIEGMEAMEKVAKTSTSGIATSIANAKTAIVRGVANLIKSFSDALTQANLPSLNEIITLIGKKAEQIIKKIADKLPEIIKTMVDLYKSIKPFLPILEALGAGILAIVVAYTTYQKIVSIVTAVQSALNFVMAMNPIALIVLAIVGLIAILVVLWKKCEGFRNVVMTIFNAIKTAFMVVVNAVKTGIQFIINIFTTIIDFIKNNWKSLLLFLVNPFAGAFKLLYDNCEGFRKFVDGFINAVINFFKKLPSNIANIAKAIVDTLLSIPKKMINIGLDIVKGIGNGITSGINWIKDRIKEFVGNVTKFIKKLFKIGSPSKLMADEIGQWLPKGVAVGIEANTDSVEDAMDDMYDEMNRMIKVENGKLNFDVVSGNVYNKSFFQTPVSIDLNAEVEMDSQKVGRLVTPSVTRTIKNGGGVR